MQNTINYLITDTNITVNYQGQTHIVKRSDALADDLIRAIKENRLDDVPNLVSVARAMENKSKGNVVFRDGELLVKGVRVPTELAHKIQKFIDEGLPYQPLVKFAENLQSNPSFRAVNELFQFLEKNDHPLTQDGNFIAYKRVRSDFKDIHSGTFDNSPGTTVEIPRNQVDEDSSRVCSAGLHVANWSYAHTQFASHDPDTDIMLEVEVNPAHVVAIPNDYNQSKMRVSCYKVLGIVTTEFTDSSLRITDSDFSPEEHYTECGKPMCAGYEAFLASKKEFVVNFCLDCDCEIENDYELCEDCELIREDNEEECESCGGNHQDCDG